MLHFNSQKGSAIIIALFISMVGFSLAFFMIKLSRDILYSSEMLMDKLQAKLLAESFIEKLKFYASTGRFYSNYIENTKLRNFPSRLYIDGRLQKIDNLLVRLYDTNSKFNIWYLQADAIKRFLKLKGVERTKLNIIHDSLIDWYDRDEFSHLNGAEIYYYKYRLNAKYSPRNFPAVQSLEEWRLIRGLNKKIFSKLYPYLTFSTYWKPNVNTMDQYMISAIVDIPLDIAKELIELRNSRGILNIQDVERITLKKITPETLGFSPSLCLDVKVKAKFRSANEKLECLISFIPEDYSPYKVLRWEE